MNKYLLSFVLIFSIGCSSSSRHSNNDAKNEMKESYTGCLATKEYVTTLQFLRSQKDFSLADDVAQNIASNVSKGCNGASSRFIKIANLLVNAGVDSKTSIETAQKFIATKDETVDAFVTIFKYSFLPDYLDLDILTSLQNASKLSVDFDGVPKYSQTDFKEMVSYCVGRDMMDLAKPRCAELAVTVAKSAKDFDSPAFPGFKRIYEFMLSSKGANLIASDALNKSIELIAYGPTAPENFVSGYRYAISKNGLHLSQQQALNFAVMMAKQSKK